MGKSSKDKRDIFYRLAKEQGYRARSAFKLIQIDEAYKIFDGVHRVVDLCAAPGSWSQVISQKLAATGDNGTVLVSVDLQPMAPMKGCIMLQADITAPNTHERILAAFGSEKADLVVTDGAPDVTGLHDLDTYLQHQLLTSSLELTQKCLKDGGVFVAKIFQGGDIELLLAQAQVLFDRVTVHKPRSSRASSMEAFLICEGYRPAPRLGEYTTFMQVGDLSMYDSR